MSKTTTAIRVRQIASAGQRCVHVGLILLLLAGLVGSPFLSEPTWAASQVPVSRQATGLRQGTLQSNTTVGIRYIDGNVVVDPAMARTVLGDTVIWQASASLQKDPALRDLAAVEVFFKDATPFGDDMSFSTPPGMDFATPITSSQSTRLGRYPYGVRLKDAAGGVLLEIDPEVWVADAWYTTLLPLVMRQYPAPPRPYITNPVAGTTISPTALLLRSIHEEPPHQPVLLEPGVTAVNLQHSGAPIGEASFAYRQGNGPWIAIGTVGGDVEVWHVGWDIAGLDDDAYTLRVVMTDTLGQAGQTEIAVWLDPTPPIPTIVYPAPNATVSGTVPVTAVTAAADVVSMSVAVVDEWAYPWPSLGVQQQPRWGNAHSHGNVRQDEVGEDADDGNNNFCGPTAASNALEGLVPADNRAAQVDRAKELARLMGTDANSGTANLPPGPNFEDGLEQYIDDHDLDLTVSKHHSGEDDAGTKSYPVWSDLASEFTSGEQIVVLIVDAGADGLPGTDDDGPGHYMGVSNVQNGNANPNQRAIFHDPATGAATSAITVTEDGANSTPMTLEYDGQAHWIQSFWDISQVTKTNATQACTDIDGGDGWSCPLDTTIYTPAWMLIEVSMTDADGNTGSAMQMIDIREYCLPPYAPAISWDPELPATGEVVTFTGSASGTAPIEYYWDLGDGITGTGQVVTHVYTEAGTVEVEMLAMNLCGSADVSQTIVITPSCQPPYNLDFDWTPPLPIVGEIITFTGSASGTGPMTYLWDFGDGITGTGQVITHVYAEPAEYYVVTMVASNPCGAYPTTRLVQVLPGCEPPVDVTFVWQPDPPIAGQVITFTGSAGGTEPLAYDWDFGDGITGTGAIAPHVYEMYGYYTVTLLVRNECGEAIVSAPIIVRPPFVPRAGVLAAIYLPLGAAGVCMRR